MHYEQREAVAAVEGFDRCIMILQMFKSKAVAALPIIDSILKDLDEDGTDKEDHFRYEMLNRLKRHLIELHKLEST